MKSISQYLINKSTTQLDNQMANNIIRHKQIVVSPFAYDNGLQILHNYKKKRLKFLKNSLDDKYWNKKYKNLASLLQKNKYTNTTRYVLKFFNFYRKIKKQRKKNFQKNKKLVMWNLLQVKFKYLKSYAFHKKHLANKFKPFSYYHRKENKIKPLFKIGFKNELKNNSKYNFKKKLLSCLISNKYRSLLFPLLSKRKKKKKKRLIFKTNELLDNNLLSTFRIENQPLTLKLIKKNKQRKKQIYIKRNYAKNYNKNYKRDYKKNYNKDYNKTKKVQEMISPKKIKSPLYFKKHSY